MLLIATPLFIIFMADTIHSWYTLIWLWIAAIWLIYESIADRQIIHFLKNKKKWDNIVYTWGLWKYSRNPNYFGESLFWLGISIISLPISYFWIIGYLTITFLLLYVSWVPMKEKRQAKKENWKDYAEKTNRFIPMFQKK